MKQLVLRLQTLEEVEYIQRELATGMKSTDSMTVSFDGTLIHVCSKTDSEAYVCRLAKPLADCVIAYYEPKLVKRLIDIHYGYFSSEEKAKIHMICMNMLSSKELLNSLFQIRRRNMVHRQLMESLECSEDEFIFIGFINFRLKNYMTELGEVVDKAVDDFLIDKEREEFVRLLKYFVDIQDVKQDFVQVLQLPDGKYSVTDGEGKDLSSDMVSHFINDLSDRDINYGDFLISCLITLAPRRILLKGKFADGEPLTTIKAIFKEAVIEEG